MQIKVLDLSAHFPASGSAEVTIDGVTFQLFATNGQKGNPLGTIKHVTWHWSAGRYFQVWNDYHFMVVADFANGVLYIIKCLPLTAEGEHVWWRNTGNCGISAASMDEATKENFGECPMTVHHVEGLAIVAAEVCAWHDLDPAGMVTLPEYRREGAGTPNDRLVATGGTIQAPVLGDHAFFAKADQYEADRWDIFTFYQQTHDRTLEIHAELKGKPMPDGTQRHFYLADLFKGA